MLPWIRVPIEKSNSDQFGEPGRRIQAEPDPVARDQRMVQVDRHPAVHRGPGPLARVVALHDQVEGPQVLGEVADVRVPPRQVLADRPHLGQVRRDVERHRRQVVEFVHLAGLGQRRALHEHRRAADDVDLVVGEAELAQVVAGELTAHPDRRRAFQHGPDEALHGRTEGLAALAAFALDRGLGADAHHGDRDLQLLDQVRQAVEGIRVVHPERVGQRDDHVVVLGVDRVRRLADHAGRLHRGALRGQDPDAPPGRRPDCPTLLPKTLLASAFLGETTLNGDLWARTSSRLTDVLPLLVACGDPRSQVVLGRPPPVGVGRDLVAGADVLDLGCRARRRTRRTGSRRRSA